MENLNDRSKNYWSGRAAEFSGLRMKDYMSSMRTTYEDFLSELLPEHKNSIQALDVGTGAGFFALILKKLGCKVTAVDFSAEMLEQARKNAREKGLPDIVFRQMDAQNLTFADNSFDFIVTRNVTWIVEDARRVYYHIHRVLKPGGILVNLDANYGKVFQESEQRGEAPTHPTQTREQLRERNDLAKACAITQEKRPAWDVEVLIDLGVSKLWVDLDLDKSLGLAEANRPYISGSAQTKARMFAVIAKKA